MLDKILHYYYEVLFWIHVYTGLILVPVRMRFGYGYTLKTVSGAECLAQNMTYRLFCGYTHKSIARNLAATRFEYF